VGRWLRSLFLLALTSTIAAGCAQPTRTAYDQPVVARDLLYSPAWTGLPTFDIARSPWPSTVAFETLGEFVDYRETIIDRQGWTDFQRDFYYRRFDAVRTGRWYR
jgi:hypothetical protein